VYAPKQHGDEIAQHRDAAAAHEEDEMERRVVESRRRGEDEAAGIEPSLGDDRRGRPIVNAIAAHPVVPITMLPELGEDLLDESELADAAFQPLVDAGDHGSVETDSGHHQETPRADRSCPYRTRFTEGGEGGKPGGIARQADLVREHVAGAERQDGERQIGVAEPVDDLVDGAVAAGRDYRVKGALAGLAGEGLGVAPRRRLAEDDDGAEPPAMRQDAVKAAHRTATGHWVVDHQQAARPKRSIGWLALWFHRRPLSRSFYRPATRDTQSLHLARLYR